MFKWPGLRAELDWPVPSDVESEACQGESNSDVNISDSGGLTSAKFSNSASH